MKKLLAAVGLSLILVSAAANAAVPSLQQIQQSIAQGNWQRADAQLSQVIDAYPDNARARYLYGQVLDREGRSTEALAQIERAKSLDPQLRFTDPSRFAQTEARVRADARRVAAQTSRPATSGGMLAAQQTQAQAQSQFAAVPAASMHRGPSTGMWIGIAVLTGAIALVLRWTLRRARSTDDKRADEERRAQLKRATDILNDVRPLKLDARLSTAPGAAALNGEIETLEAQARELVETLSNGKNPAPPYRLDELEKQCASLKARVEGRPDPNAAAAGAPGNSGSVFAQEADRLTGAPGQPPYSPYPPQPQQPPVVIQQGGGFGGGMGGLLTGVLLGEAMSHGRDRVIERDVIADDEARRRAADPGVDFGQGDSWDSGGGVDLGSSGDDWSNNG
ncbi:tetratricopeptide repeat protein [Burkholderia oklahomensis]|uniref:tetratricopeptide repeat protein n=1 Tax=Burkholderia oklahomensis TaxID=342113 RepID=UPI00265254ED|nr:tetratricopeptide repeat protein [Burkholderia oklahomensis]MDN7671827.1 tetratricopeptide repeat protein [Burkholderia oklahomensis]